MRRMQITLIKSRNWRSRTEVDGEALLISTHWNYEEFTAARSLPRSSVEVYA